MACSDMVSLRELLFHGLFGQDSGHTLGLKRSSDIGIVVRTQAVLEKPCLLRSLDIDPNMSSWFERCLDMDINVMKPTFYKVLLFLELSGQHCGHAHYVCLMSEHQGQMSRHGRWLGL